MAKHKKRQFEEFSNFKNVFEIHFFELEKNGFLHKGNWGTNYFKNNNPIVLELGCGKGEYTVGLAKQFPTKNFIGIDIKGNRMWRGAKTAIEEGLDNVAFIRTHIGQINKYFAEGEVSEIWITFPDPQPREGHEKKRLTAPRFLNYYKNLLNPEGLIHLKTDSRELFNYTLSIIEENKHNLLYKTFNVYQTDATDPVLTIKTYYEKLFGSKGFEINYLKFQLSK